MTVLEQTKLLLGITGTEQDELLNFILSVVTRKVKDYCRLPNIEATEYLLPDMVVDRYRTRGYGKEEAPKTVTGISEGGLSVSYKTTQGSASMELTDAEKASLITYRKLWP